jgi:hypothetical protein
MTCLSDAPDAPKKPLAVLRYSATALPSITLSWKAGTANGSPISNYQICFQRTTKSTSPFQSVSPTGADNEEENYSNRDGNGGVQRIENHTYNDDTARAMIKTLLGGRWQHLSFTEDASTKCVCRTDEQGYGVAVPGGGFVEFRVRAQNSNGWGPFSKKSAPVEAFKVLPPSAPRLDSEANSCSSSSASGLDAHGEDDEDDEATPASKDERRRAAATLAKACKERRAAEEVLEASGYEIDENDKKGEGGGGGNGGWGNGGGSGGDDDDALCDGASSRQALPMGPAVGPGVFPGRGAILPPPSWGRLSQDRGYHHELRQQRRRRREEEGELVGDEKEEDEDEHEEKQDGENTHCDEEKKPGGSASGVTFLNLEWDAPSNAQSSGEMIGSYELQFVRCGNCDSDTVTVTVPGDSGEPKVFTTVQGLLPGNRYRFRVRAICNAGFTDWSLPSGILSTSRRF